MKREKFWHTKDNSARAVWFRPYLFHVLIQEPRAETFGVLLYACAAYAAVYDASCQKNLSLFLRCRIIEPIQ